MSGLLQQRDQSMLTFESASVLGTSAIVEKLVSLPFKAVKHAVDTLDAQPTALEGGILVMVTGGLMVCVSGDASQPMLPYFLPEEEDCSAESYSLDRSMRKNVR